MLKIACCLLSVVVLQVACHGMLLDPPNRSSLWRFDNRFPINYNDNENFCGGISVQWNQNGGKCGVCGDNLVAPHPQDNENTGKYGRGHITNTYKAGQVINTYARLTTNHKGWMQFSLCQLNNSNGIESGEDCFKVLKFSNGQDKHDVYSGQNDFYMQVKLPDGFKCNHCVLRWHYKGGNNWGQCANGSWATGCGPQETFRSCADISIN